MELLSAFILGGVCGAGAFAAGTAVRGRGGRADGLRPVPLPAAAAVPVPAAEPPAGGRPEALVLVDVDGLARLNEAAGPDIGDRLLERIADVSRRTMPPGAAMERLDGGRFVFWLASGGTDAAIDFAEALRIHVTRTSVEASGTRISRTVSAGVVRLSGGEARARALMAAEAALRRAKRLGGDRVALAAGPVHPKGPTVDEVQAAIRSGQLGYHVQPIWDLASGRAVGVEALLRWTRGDGRTMRPADFLHRLDRLDGDTAALFVDLAVDAARPFVEAGRPLFVSFNVSAGALEDDQSQSRAWLRALMDRLPTDRLMLELLESAVVTCPDRARAALGGARTRGTRIALDDFGTGLSNLDRMLDLAPDVVKLDRALLSGLGECPRAEAMVRGVAGMADAMGFVLLAEGIETPIDAELVQGLGARWGQGFHLGRPAPVAEWAARLR
ncbi:bifunctional diguanylate cyclase/phosphodiesterase [Jannaschia sp. W003]|uniref:bifunctional diguanylate cyclase/phosphodiesterase n=1 Tax=Jannaschia sp. W003 TaxID=2867012 RepID=UPI0021A78C02|nr:bifunctional diguanylate cyclase/phosphodiesterase [Jannaschia sp. W003]UWQ22736.1 bifunctional diguanylate cyclase/phosphodiesterase [Jannaschia sp. W003]